jgi:predicted RNA-binding protein associated with RNAse of E/G family
MASDIQSWCESVAELGVDMLVDSGLIKKEDFAKATAIVAEEILVRLTMGDYPPLMK